VTALKGARNRRLRGISRLVGRKEYTTMTSMRFQSGAERSRPPNPNRPITAPLQMTKYAVIEDTQNIQVHAAIPTDPNTPRIFAPISGNVSAVMRTASLRVMTVPK
jgi:hypothetical protein